MLLWVRLAVNELLVLHIGASLPLNLGGLRRCLVLPELGILPPFPDNSIVELR